MSEKIDWSKAPESAMVLLKHVRDNSYAWAVSHADESDAWIVDGTCFGFRLMAYCWRVVSKRPAAPSWSGEGLPPVRVVCEVIDGLSNEFTKQFNGKQVEIVAHSKDENYETAVFKVIGFLYDGQARYHSLVASCFKPIRTQEQIAADERSKAIDEMVKALGMDDPGTAEYIRCGLIYDAGFRKP